MKVIQTEITLVDFRLLGSTVSLCTDNKDNRRKKLEQNIRRRNKTLCSSPLFFINKDLIHVTEIHSLQLFCSYVSRAPAECLLFYNRVGRIYYIYLLFTASNGGHDRIQFTYSHIMPREIVKFLQR